MPEVSQASRMPAVAPEVPEHIRPTDASEELSRFGVVWCLRCGRVIENSLHDVAARECQVVPVTFRGDELNPL
jgi:hypothetical protein